jgi:Peptidase propeptide and YPEB domain
MGRALMIAAVLALSFRVGDMAFADADDMTVTNVPRDQWRPVTQIIEQFTTMGYQVRGIEGRRQSL